MTKETIHFAHANGFPAKVYSKLFSFLEKDFRVNYLERHAHNPKFPVTDGWARLRDELREELEKRYTQPVIGVGHSLGGILHFLVAVENPELYKQIILLDAPIISRLSSLGLKFLKKTNLMQRYFPSHLAKFRRAVWSSKTEAFEYFKKKAKFAAFDEDVLRDYIEHGTSEAPEGVKLVFNTKIEGDIYRMIPHHLAGLRRKLKVPAAYIGGTRSREAKFARLGFMKKYLSIDFYFIEGTHLFPFENPLETARTIKIAVSKIKNKP